MWGGKTHALSQSLNSAQFRGLKALAIEPCVNTRNSERDLHNIKNTKFDKIVLHEDNADKVMALIKDSHVVGFDEIHFYSSKFNKKLSNIFIDCLQSAREHCEQIYLAGIALDNNVDNRVFESVAKIMLLCDRIVSLPSSKPCSLCGSKSDVFFAYRNITKKDLSSTENLIGDCYSVFCWDCYARSVK